MNQSELMNAFRKARTELHHSQEAIYALDSIELHIETLQVSVNSPCSVCTGKPLASGRKCICGGIGTEHAEFQGIRKRLVNIEIALGMFPNVSKTISECYEEVREILKEEIEARDKLWCLALIRTLNVDNIYAVTHKMSELRPDKHASKEEMDKKIEEIRKDLRTI